MEDEKYGITQVVAGFGVEITPDEAIPYTLARTYKEHHALRGILKGQHFDQVLEVGCGYGRNIPVLQEFSYGVTGVEKDPELAALATKLNPKALIVEGTLWEKPLFFREKPLFFNDAFQLLLTCTFLQHLKDDELALCAVRMTRFGAPGARMILIEETNSKLRDEKTTGRSVDEYKSIFHGFQLQYTYPREIEATYPEEDSGTIMVFQKV